MDLPFSYADFEQIIGVPTSDGILDAMREWSNVNLANARDEQAQNLARHFVMTHAKIMERPSWSGLIEFNASLANQRALQIARDITGKNGVICSNLSHVSVHEACITLGMRAIVLDADPNLDYQVPERHIANSLKKDNDIAAIVSTHGTTQLGTIERIGSYETVQLARKRGIWLHVDGAYGALVTQYTSLKRKYPLPNSDSLTIDSYKIASPGAALVLTSPENIGKLDVPYYSHSEFMMYTTFLASSIAAWASNLKDAGGSFCSEIEECLQRAELTSRIVPTISSLTSVGKRKLIISSFATKNRDDADNLRTSLFDKGIAVGNLQIQGRDYQVEGIRIVHAPRPFMDWGRLSDLYSRIKEFYKK